MPCKFLSESLQGTYILLSAGRIAGLIAGLIAVLIAGLIAVPADILQLSSS